MSFAVAVGVALVAAVGIACLAWVAVLAVMMTGSLLWGQTPSWQIELERMRERGEVPRRVTQSGGEQE